MPWARSFLGFQPASTDTKVPAKRCILLFTLQKACYTRSVCLSPAKRLFIVVNVVFVVFPPQQAISERERARWQGSFLSCGEVPLVGAVDGWPVGSPWGSSSSLTQGGWQGRQLMQPGPQLTWLQAGFCYSLGREVLLLVWAVRPADPPRVSVAQRAAALVSAARGGRLEGGRKGEVGGELHRARVLRAAVAPLVEGEAGLRSGSDGLRAALVEGAAARDATLALVGRADRQRVLLGLTRRAARVGGASRIGGASIRVDGRGDIHVGLTLLDGLEDGRLGRSRGHEVELGVGEEVAELAARLPADRDALDVLRAELLCRLRALAAERQGEVAELAEADLLALQQLLAHAVDCHVEDRHDVGAGVGRAVVGDVAGKLLDGHHLGILCRGEVVGDDGLDECLVLGVGLLALGLGLVDTRLGLVDLEEIRVDGSCRDAVVDHCV